MSSQTANNKHAPKWMLKLPNTVERVSVAYIGLQKRSDSDQASNAEAQAISLINVWLSSPGCPDIFEAFSTIDGAEKATTMVWACYWLRREAFEDAVRRLSLVSLFGDLPGKGRADIGIWCEAFATPVSRIETNYSSSDNLRGYARLPGAELVQHEIAGFWRAARQRIPSSAFDTFPACASSMPAAPPRGISQRVFGTNFHNMAHIRSGQFWEDCGQDEADSYENELEPLLHKALTYLWETKESGAMGTRYLRNGHPQDMAGGTPRKETCGTSFFRSLESLEEWAKSHPKHVELWRGALDHCRIFGETRSFRIWHEASVLEQESATFEYVNCLPETGLMKHLSLNVDELSI